jgi:hypothetical protein
MELGGSLPYLRESNTFPCSEPNQSKSEIFVKGLQHGTFLRWRLISISYNTQPGGPPFVLRSRLFIQYTRSVHPYRSPFLHRQTEDA